ncbi:MAG: M81 family metallopeptidase [Erysipelotrichaceae bacterium]|nr:M81 family metallopeptidase [Erysipelotrichaceae bacterium]
MKVLLAHFTNEANANVPNICEFDQMHLSYGDKCIEDMHIREVFEQSNIEMLPAIMATSGSSGVIAKEVFDYITAKITRVIKENINSIDGVFLEFHGASYVEEIGSGDFYLLERIRELLGPYIPIAIVCDPHGNLTKEYVESTQIIRSYRESPHTDAIESDIRVAKELIDIMQNRQNIHSIYRKLPLILGGEQSVSTDEPVLSINKYMDEMEKDPRVRSASWHVGYIRHDCPEAGCAIVVVPQTANDIEYCEQKADELAKYVWDKRHEFHYTGYTAEPDKAIEEALAFDGKPVFITDSGDNSTSGSTGANTFVLRQFLAIKDLKKKVLFASICDVKTFKQLSLLNINDICEIDLGANYDELSESVHLQVKIIASGGIKGFMMFDHNKVFAHTITVNIINTNIYIIVADNPYTLCEMHQYEEAGLNIDDYDIIIVKQGYIFPDLKAKGKLSIMSLTNGATLQNTAKLPFKLICRPMYPIDNI